MDISEQCNKSLEEQMELFESIKPLFTNKPILVCLNKVDVLQIEDLPEEKKVILKKFEEDGKSYIAFLLCLYLLCANKVVKIIGLTITCF